MTRSDRISFLCRALTRLRDSASPNRSFAALLLAIVALSAPVFAADYPVRPVRFVVAHVPGTTVDLMARLLGQKLSDAWGQPVLVENRAGAAGAVGAQSVAKAAPDGYTLLFSTNAPITTIPVLHRNLGYDAGDFEPVIVVAEGVVFLLVNPGLPVRTIAEFIALAKQKPGGLFTATPGPGSIGHFAIAELHRSFGVSLTHVPYKGGVSGTAAVASGEVQVGIFDTSAVASFLKDGRVRALGVTGKRRSIAFPEVPTLDELGLTGFDVVAWMSVVAPRGTPRDVVQRINAEINRARQDPVLRQKLIGMGAEPLDGGTSEEFAAYLVRDLPRWQQRVKDAELKVD